VVEIIKRNAFAAPDEVRFASRAAPLSQPDPWASKSLRGKTFSAFVCRHNGSPVNCERPAQIALLIRPIIGKRPALLLVSASSLESARPAA